MIKTVALSAFLLSSVSFGAVAAPILAGSVINFAGQSTCNATTCTFGNAISTGGVGSFSSFTFGTPATFAVLTFSPFTSEQVYTSTSSGGLTTTFTVTAQLSETAGTTGGLTNVNITDRGIATLTGFDPTPGTFTFTANQSGSLQGSFSATTATGASAVPEPMSLALLGSGLIGLGIIRRKRHSA